MRKLLVVVTLSLLAALAVPGLALATHSNGAGPPDDFIRGTADGPLPTPCGNINAHFHVSADAAFENGGAGPNAKGQFWTKFDSVPSCGPSGVTYRGEIVCVEGYFLPPFTEDSAN